MRILVTGASGFIGRHLVSFLKDKDVNLVCLTRNNKITDKKVKWIVGDITKQNSISGITEGIEVVYHLAAVMNTTAKKKDSFYESNIKGTKNIISECKKTGSKLIYISTVGVYGPGLNFSEESKVNPTNLYEKTKYESEKLILESGLDYIILRSGLVFGPGDKNFGKIFWFAKKGFFISITNPLIHPIFVKDLVNCLFLVRKLKKERLNVTGEYPLRINDFLRLINKKIKIIHIPNWLAIFFAINGSLLQKIIRKDFLFNLSKYGFLTEDRTFNIKKLKKTINLKFTSLEKAISYTKKFY